MAESENFEALEPASLLLSSYLLTSMEHLRLETLYTVSLSPSVPLT